MSTNLLPDFPWRLKYRERRDLEERLLALLETEPVRHHKTKALQVILACNRGDQNCDECPVLSCSDNTSRNARIVYAAIGKDILND